MTIHNWRSRNTQLINLDVSKMYCKTLVCKKGFFLKMGWHEYLYSPPSNGVLVRALKWDFHLETRDRDVMSITDKYMSLAIFPTFPPLLQNVISLMSVWLVFSVTFFFVNALFNVSSKASNTRLHRVIFNLIREFFVEGYKKYINATYFLVNFSLKHFVTTICKVIWQKILINLAT